ncbi:histone-lysine N-methyltransferase, H3 lysine-79 specific-like isoform X2 [Melanaphis sacchari]|uniref:histone-lysine N-methyltransferase, H3 lysine-79 specific-like isoform X2 n=1 Tax=Melanaphis sacchari TaxID=742174 RepID=UPI000DC13848|nr:histone-lysine N-methyltransferase, H3 lysine-79 specific-like isoform X2 [Melanaphis sacchari]
MCLTSVVLTVGLTIVFAKSCYSNFNHDPHFVSGQVPSMTREDQFYSSNMPLPSMAGNQNFYPIPQQPMMPGFQPFFPFNPINQQQLSLLLMSTYARMISLLQLMSMQNRYQPYNQYSALNNFVQSPVPLPYVQPPQVEKQKSLEHELLQQQIQQAEEQHRAILEEQRIQREYDMEIQKHEELIRQLEEEENNQKEIEHQLLNEIEEEKKKKEAEQKILEEEQKERKRKENDFKSLREEELKLQNNEEKKIKQIKGMKPKIKVPQKPNRKPRKSIS